MTLLAPKAELPTELSDNMIKQFGTVPEPVEVNGTTRPLPRPRSSSAQRWARGMRLTRA